MVIGIIFAVILCGAIPISVGANKGQPVLGVIGGVCAGGTAVLFGCLGGLPVAGLFCVIIMAVAGSSSGRPKYGRRRDYDDYDDEEDDYEPRQRRKRRRDEDDEDDEDDYDRSSRRWER